jgi:hypothetical protein
MGTLLSFDTAWRASVLLLAATQTLSSLELLSKGSIFEDDGILGRRLAMLRSAWMQRPLMRSVLWHLWEPGTFRGLLFARLAVALAVALFPSQTVPLAALTALNILVSLRLPSGRDGADQMSSIALAALTLGAFGDDTARVLSVWFVAAQGILSYVVAGVAKAAAKGWWTGGYLRAILSTTSYGDVRSLKILRRYPLLSTAASVGVIVFECTFWAVLVLPPKAAVIFLVMGFLFHAANAAVMGLNNFVWAFVATYPCILVLRAAIVAS